MNLMLSHEHALLYFTNTKSFRSIQPLMFSFSSTFNEESYKRKDKLYQGNSDKLVVLLKSAHVQSFFETFLAVIVRNAKY